MTLHATAGYMLGQSAQGEPFIICLTCQMKSYNSGDIANRFCGMCKVFHSHEIVPEDQDETRTHRTP